MASQGVAEPRFVAREFALSAEEQRLFAFLLDVVRERCPGVELRVAGGWVRDKLMGRESHDVDIALNVVARHFVEHVNAALEARHEERHSVGLIKSRPELSKHLETATTRILGFLVDFVHLRRDDVTAVDAGGEATAAHVGTAREDALRRDLTVNALFYHVNLDRVEDWSGRGIDDLRQRRLCTPLSAHITWSDDPCRVLRAIRFQAKLGFTLAPELLAEARAPALRQALMHSISRERIGKELLHMLHGTLSHLLLFIMLLS